jgi:hypothetical protein
MSTKLHRFTTLVAVILALALAIPAFGQGSGTGNISGTVVDQNGAVVPGAKVLVINKDTGAKFDETANNEGAFGVNRIPVGTYRIEITAANFKKQVIEGVIVSAGATLGLGNVTVKPGASTEIEVTTQAPLVQAETPQVTNTFSGTVLNNFAGIQENEGLDRMALFIPGVTSSRSNNFSNTNGASIASNGIRGRNNDQQIDGQNNNDNSVGGPGLFVSNPEFVQQYVVVTNQFGAEYGRNSGSVVNIITKSGTNNWHGSVVERENSNFLNALSNTQHNTNKPGTVCPAGTPPPGICNPFTGPPRFNDEFGGGTIGGPIVKNKVFVFGGFLQELQNGGAVFTTSSQTPTPAGLAQLAGCGVSDVANLAILQKFGPYAFGFGNPSPRGSPSLQTIGTCDGVINPKVPFDGVTRVINGSLYHEFDWDLRNDVQLGHDNFSARYLFNRGNSFFATGTGSTGWIGNVPALSQAIYAADTHNFGAKMVNEFRVAYARLGVVFGGGPNPFFPPDSGLLQAFTNISFNSTFATLGPATNLPQSRLVNTSQLQDNWNYTVGQHTLKAGTNVTYQRTPNVFLPNVNGQFRFTNMRNFLGAVGSSAASSGSGCFPAVTASCGAPNRVQIAAGAPNFDFREWDTFIYGGDDWKMRPNLTVNLGITWTYYGSPANLFNNVTTTRESNNTITPGCALTNTCALWLQSLPLSVRTDPFVPAVKNSFGPSVGFAYTPQWGGFMTGHGKTTFRGGYRLLYDPPFYNIFLNISSSAPMTFLQTITAGLNNTMLPATPTGPNVRANLAGFITPNTFDPRTQNETVVTPNFGPDKVHEWSFGMQREVGRNSALEIRYVGNHGFNLYQTNDGNPYVGTAAAPGLAQFYPNLLPAGVTACAATTQSGPGAGTDVGRANCGLGVTRQRANTAYSNYTAVQSQWRLNNWFHQLDGTIGYTWSHTLDNTTEIFATGTAGNTAFTAQNPFCVGSCEYANSGLNFPHVFTVNLTERLPFFKNQKGWIGHFLGGWGFSGDYLLGSGQPYTPIQGLSEAIATSPGNFYDSAYTLAFLGLDSAHPFLGSLSAPANSVGVYASDFCKGALGIAPAANNALPGACNTNLTNPNALISYNNMNSIAGIATAGAALPGNPGVVVQPGQVRFIVNGAVAQGVFGTPFGNMPRNVQTDAISNILNASIFKNIKLGEKANFEMRLTALNALNHFNFTSIDPNVEDAGVGAFGADFANPAVTSANGRVVWIGGRLTW